MIFAYYVMLRYCGALAKNGQLSPVLGAWLANLVAGSAGLAMLARSPK
jgi:lipopolysaccharide export LptBFGC system permease protein LptF